MNDQGLLTRKQRIVKQLQHRGPGVSPWVASLPSMLRRHGLLQVLLFLVAKQDRRVAEDLIAGIKAALSEEEAQEIEAYISELANEENLALTLRRSEAAIEVASLLKMLARAPGEVP